LSSHLEPVNRHRGRLAPDGVNRAVYGRCVVFRGGLISVGGDGRILRNKWIEIYTCFLSKGRRRTGNAKMPYPRVGDMAIG
jgi:hypothetical protein